jgi:hypothetical protein
MFDYFFVVLLTGSAALVFLLGRAYPQTRVVLGAYCGTYFATTVIGAAATGIFGAGMVASLNYGLDISLLQEIATPRYWGLLFAPLVIPPLVLAVLINASPQLSQLLATDPPRGPLPESREAVDPMLFNLWFLVCAGYCCVGLFTKGYLANIQTMVDIRGDYVAMIRMRTEMASVMGSSFFGLVYIGLQTLSFCALFEMVRTRNPVWGVTFLFTVFICSALCLSIISKGHVLIYMAILALGLIELGVIRWWALSIALGALLVVLTFLQTFYTEDWSMADSLWLAVFRMGVSFPYYLNLFPDVLPHYGVDLGLHLLGLDEPKVYSVDIALYMYPSVRTAIEGGACPGSSHMAAFAEAGLGYALFIIVLSGFCLAAVSRLRVVHRQGPLSFALYLTALVFLYYLTQTSMREAIISCYGIFWGFAVLAPLYLISQQYAQSAAPSEEG